METFIVICLDDSPPDDDRPGPYVLASRQIFITREVATTWARGLSQARRPLVVGGDWTDLRVRGE